MRLLEHGKIDSGFKYHEVFTDGRYVYDPRLSNAAVPLGDLDAHDPRAEPWSSDQMSTTGREVIDVVEQATDWTGFGIKGQFGFCYDLRPNYCVAIQGEGRKQGQ